MLFALLGKIWKRLPPRARIFTSRVFQAKFSTSAGGIITNEGGEVLLLNHVLRPSSGWGVPGGFMERGEQPEDAFRREIREETRLELRNVEFYRARTSGSHIEFMFRAEAVGTASVNSREITELGWFGIDRLPAEMSVDQKSFVRAALEGRPLKTKT